MGLNNHRYKASLRLTKLRRCHQLVSQMFIFCWDNSFCVAVKTIPPVLSRLVNRRGRAF